MTPKQKSSSNRGGIGMHKHGISGYGYVNRWFAEQGARILDALRIRRRHSAMVDASEFRSLFSKGQYEAKTEK